MRAIRPGNRGEKSPTKEPGRKCPAEGCPTVLSIYNPADTCFAHLSPSLGSTRERA